MPSVRVRRGSRPYTSLYGDENVEQPAQGSSDMRRARSETLASLYRPPGSPPQPPQEVAQSQSERRPESPEAHPHFDYLAPPPRDMSPGNTQRYASLRSRQSRIAGSILSTRLSQRQLRGRSGSTAARPSSMDSDDRRERRSITLEGSQADIVIPDNNGHPGLIGSSLSIASSTPSNAGSYDDSSEDELHHEDEIVEHLDVIDPQVATISNLANAANSILIPPIGVYSRKPVVVLPKLPGSRPTSDAEKGEGIHEDDLDRHVEDVLKRQSKFKRTMSGVWAFMKTPMGIVTSIYGFLVVFWGAAIVIFLIKIIDLHNSSRQGFWVEVSSQIENALFTVTGVGLIPWRVIDTYRIIKIWHYKKLTRRLRKKAGLPALYDEDDLPDPMYDPNYVHVLTDKQQKKLHRLQQHFMKSQTWYRAHGTPTHRAFPINFALLICLFNDGNSAFQCVLCGCMWGLNRFQRPAWTTGSLIPITFLCGISSAVCIWKGTQRTKREKEVRDRLRMALELEKNPNKLMVVNDQVVPVSEAGSGSPNGTSPPTDKQHYNHHSNAVSSEHPPTPPEKDTPKIRFDRNRISGDSMMAEAGTEPNVDSVYIDEKMTVPQHVK